MSRSISTIGSARAKMLRSVSFVWSWLIAVSVLLAVQVPAIAQFFPTTEPAFNRVTEKAFLPVFTQGNIQLSPLFLDGRVIATVSSFIDIKGTSRTVESDPPLTASQRAFAIHARLQKYLTSMSAYSSKMSTWSNATSIEEKQRVLEQELSTKIRKNGRAYEILIVFPKGDPPELLGTVTPADVERVRLLSSVPEELATRTALHAKRALLEAWKQRQEPLLRSSVRTGIIGLLVFAITSGLTAQVQKRLEASSQVLGTRLRIANCTDTEPDTSCRMTQFDLHRSRLQPGISLSLSLGQRLSIVSFYRSFLFWGQFLLWTCGIAWIAGLFYWSRPFSNWITGVSIRGHLITGDSFNTAGWPPLDWLLSLGREATIGAPLVILFLVMATRISIKTGNLACDQYVSRWILLQEDTRAGLRARTIAHSLKAWIRVVIYLFLGIVVFYQLNQLGAVTQAVAILLGFLSFALSLASQSLLKDLIGGMLILIEDQYAAGDVVTIGNESGMVEDIGLRVTHLRNLDGELISIPNGTIATVRNLSSSWSRVNYAVKVDISSDLETAIATMDSVAQRLYGDLAWSELILEPPEVLGVDEISHTGVLIRVLIKTKPLQQWLVAREYRRRLKPAFDAEGISVGIPKMWLVESEKA
ncbi:mechanosensitive ion channel family protein [Synechococcus sp. CCY9201]|uniref:mechanosensitive ion channel family protein n=1 Tax=Synechococcus sp. CCY9201 TaxID=174697 RepID=UPI002B1FB630|nr:mechanosensitive ion channel family protein [Synechococcus sp. CCY9201]MEA5474530.1 mechanosensitive ion channel family protein [Synechococcus sp. CCY9201]